MYNQIYHLSHTVNKSYLFYDTSFFKYKNYFQGFFLPDDYSLDIKTLQQQQSQDPVLRTVYSWLLNNEKLEFVTPLITGTPFLLVYYKRFSQLFINESTNLISLYITNPTVNNQSSTPNFVQDTIRICLPFRLFKTVFNKLHEHSHTGMKITYNTFKQYYYIPFLEKWLSIFIHDCIECQRNKHFNMKIQTAPTQSFSEHAPSFNYRISMDTKGPINPPSHNKSYIHVIIEHVHTYELLAQDGSTVDVHRNHIIPYYPKEPLLYPHLRSFMRFSDTTQFQIPQPTKYANSDSSPFNSDESLSEEDSQTFVTPSSFSTSNQNTPSITPNDSSLTPSTNDNSLFRHIINTPHTIISSDRSRHSSNNQTTSLPPIIDRTTKTTYKLRQQPKLDYRLFITPSQL